MPAQESKQHDFRLKKCSISEKNTITMTYFYFLYLYSVPISWLRFIVDWIICCVLDLKPTEAGIDDKVDGSIDMSKGGSKKNALMIVSAIGVLYLQLSLRK